MTIPCVGAITATSFATAIEDPSNFRNSRAVGAWLGLTTQRYQSGEVDYGGRNIPTGRSPLAGASLRSGPGHLNPQFGRERPAKLGAQAQGAPRLQTCRDVPAWTWVRSFRLMASTDRSAECVIHLGGLSHENPSCRDCMLTAKTALHQAYENSKYVSKGSQA